jgi:hypothetical protein
MSKTDRLPSFAAIAKNMLLHCGVAASKLNLGHNVTKAKDHDHDFGKKSLHLLQAVHQ